MTASCFVVQVAVLPSVGAVGNEAVGAGEVVVADGTVGVVVAGEEALVVGLVGEALSPLPPHPASVNAVQRATKVPVVRSVVFTLQE